jgi:Shikimate kinase
MRDTEPKAVILMGVSGSGKSTVGGSLAQRLECPFLDADDFHPAAYACGTTWKKEGPFLSKGIAGEPIRGSGKAVGQNFHLAHGPEGN